MYLGTFDFSLVMKKCRITLWSREGWSPPPPFGRRFSFWIFSCSLFLMLKSLYFPFLVLLNMVLLTTSFQGLVLLLSKPLTNLPSEALLITQEITTYEMNTGMPMMLDLICVQVKGSKPIPSLVLPYRLGSMTTFSSISNWAAFRSYTCALTQKCLNRFIYVGPSSIPK